MKRRKWWFIGLSLALLAACVFAWKWSERPPYTFMRGSRFLFVEVSKKARVTYTSDREASALVADAQLEFGLRGDSMGSEDGLILWTARGRDRSIVEIDQDCTGVRRSMEGRFPPVPAGTKTYIYIYRPATLMDRSKSFLLGLRWKGILR